MTPTRASKRIGVLGGALVLLGLSGFLTVADDLRHKGELLGVSLVLAGGLVLVAVAARTTSSRRGTDGPDA